MHQILLKHSYSKQIAESMVIRIDLDAVSEIQFIT
jgi:hypothetical protein